MCVGSRVVFFFFFLFRFIWLILYELEMFNAYATNTRPFYYRPFTVTLSDIYEIRDVARTRTFYAIDVKHRIGRPDNQRPEKETEKSPEDDRALHQLSTLNPHHI